MKKYIKYSYTNKYNENMPNNNFPEEWENVTFDDHMYSFMDWLQDNGVVVEEDTDSKDFYWVLDEIEEKRTGAAYMILESVDRE